jgi:hypothetical protein
VLQSKQCPKCASSMGEGFVVDKFYGGAGVSTWVAGAPRRSMWTGINVAGREQSQIATWRCGRCGFLESYASGEAAGAGGAAARKQGATVVLLVALAAALVLALVAGLLAVRG